MKQTLPNLQRLEYIRNFIIYFFWCPGLNRRVKGTGCEETQSCTCDKFLVGTHNISFSDDNVSYMYMHTHVKCSGI